MIRYLKENPAAFDPDTVHILSGALDDAWQVIDANKAAFKIDGNADGARQILAKHIVDMAKQGRATGSSSFQTPRLTTDRMSGFGATSGLSMPGSAGECQQRSFP